MVRPNSNLQARISTFEQFIAPASPDEFLKEIFGKRPLHMSGPTDRFQYLLTWDALNSILSRHSTEGLNLRVVKDGKSVPPEKYIRLVSIEFLGQYHQLDAVELTKELRGGATLALDLYRELHEPICSLADVLESALFSRVHIAVFAGWHSTRSFDTHWDPTDIFVLQLEGKKHWRIMEPSRRHPILEDKQLRLAPPSDPYWEGDLHPGDLMHIPRGWWHDATPYSAPSLHLTFIVTPASGLDVTNALLARLKRSDFVGANVPRYATEAEQRVYMDTFRSIIGDAVADLSLEQVLADFDTKMPSRARLSLPWSAAPESQPLPDSAKIEWRPNRPVTVTQSDQDVAVETLGSTFILPRSVAAVLLDLAAKKGIRLQALQGRHPSVNVADCVQQLLAIGLVRVVAFDDESALDGAAEKDSGPPLRMHSTS